MVLIKYLLIIAGFLMFGSASALVAYDIYLSAELRRLLRRPEPEGEPHPARPIRWRQAGKLAAYAWLPLLAGLSIAVVPAGMAGVRSSQISGVRPGTLYPGVHFVVPLVQSIALADIRDHVFSTVAEPGKRNEPVLKVESHEGLPLGISVAVRYRIDSTRLDYVQSNLPQPIDEQIVAPVVESVFRDLGPNYEVREAFSSKRDEFRDRATKLITQRLAADAIVVKEVLLREIQLPPEYAEGLQGLLAKEQEDERMVVETRIHQKQVQIAEFDADAAKIRQIKQAEADSQTVVLRAKAESDSMQYTLPLKQKQIEQTKLEAQARKEATLQNADAMAQAKVIDSKAEQQRQKLLAEAEANRIRLVSTAEAEQMRLEAAALKINPLLIQKIIAERLSDKIQIVMVPSDGKFFFANDVLRGIGGATDPSGKDSSGGKP